MTHEVSARVAVRYAADEGGSEDFIKLLESLLRLDGRQVRLINKSTLGGLSYADVYVNFINLPAGIGGAGGGAEAENNRMSFWVRGFGKDDPHAPPPSGKVKVEHHTSALPREYRLRAKTGTPSQIAKYLADFLNRVVKEVEPRFTHLAQAVEQLKKAKEQRKLATDSQFVSRLADQVEAENKLVSLMAARLGREERDLSLGPICGKSLIGLCLYDNSSDDTCLYCGSKA